MPQALLFGVVVSAAAYLTLTMPFFQSFFVNSDQLTIVSLADDVLFNPRFNPFQWNFSRAPYFFPDLALSLVLRPLMRSDIAVAAAMVLIQAGFVAGVGAAISVRLTGGGGRRAGAVALYGIVLTLSLVAARSGWHAGAVAWPFVSYSHAGALDLALVGFIAVAHGFYPAPRRPIVLALSIVLTALAYCSDKTAILLFLPPAALYLLAMSRRRGPTELLVFTGIQAVALVATVAVDHALNFQVTEHNTVAGLWAHLGSAARYVSSQPVTLQAYLALIGLVTAWTLIRSTISLLAQAERAPDIRIGLAFLISCSSLFDVFLVLWLWTGDDGAYLRFAVMAEFAGPVLVVHALGSIPRLTGLVWRAAPIAFFATLLLTLAFWQGARDPFDIVEAQQRRGFQMAACISRNGLHDGYAAYWSARQLSSSTDWTIQVDQLAPPEVGLPPAVPFFWGSDVAWFFEHLRGGDPVHHDFVVLDGLSQDAVERLYGVPDAVETCGPHRLAIYRDAAKLENRVRARLASVLDITTVHRHLPASMVKAIEDGEMSFGLRDLNALSGNYADGTLSLSPSDKEGFALSGPYIKLPEGHYIAELSFVCSGNTDGSFFDVAIGDEQQEFADWQFGDNLDKCDGQVHHVQMGFDTRAPVSSVEVRTYYGGQGELSVTGVGLKRASGS